MCGIIGYTGHKSAVPYLIKGLSDLEYRGYDSSGIALCEKSGVKTVKSQGRLEKLKMKLENYNSEATCGIGHTRWATHGEPSDVNSHPHISHKGLFTVVHNGIIENYRPLKKALISEGFTFKSQTDTEVIVNLLEKYYSGDVTTALRKTLALLEGSYALGIVCSDFPDRIYAVRKGSPLICAVSDEGTFLSSDITALLPYTKEVYSLEEKEVAVLGKDSLGFFTLDGEALKKTAEPVLWSQESADKEGFDHFMLKEIHEQPSVLKATIDYLTENGELLSQIKELKKSFFTLEKICFIGCGSAYHVGVAGKIITEKLCNITCLSEIASEFRYGSVPVDEKTLCIFISQSGETADTLAALARAKEKKAKVLSVVNVAGSSIARESENILYTQAGPEIAVATTKAYTSQLIAIYLFAVCLAHERWQIKKCELNSLLSEIRLLPEKVRDIITDGNKIRKAADFFKDHSDGYFIGRGNDYAAALEGSLKMKEISYIHTEAYAAGELKHGTISLLEKNTPVVALCCDEALFKKTLSNIKEVKARGATVIIFAKKSLRNQLTDEDNVFLLPDVPDIFSVITETVALQLMSYYAALQKGCDIDKPRNLAKSVTVE